MADLRLNTPQRHQPIVIAFVHIVHMVIKETNQRGDFRRIPGFSAGAMRFDQLYAVWMDVRVFIGAF